MWVRNKRRKNARIETGVTELNNTKVEKINRYFEGNLLTPKAKVDIISQGLMQNCLSLLSPNELHELYNRKENKTLTQADCEMLDKLNWLNPPSLITIQGVEYDMKNAEDVKNLQDYYDIVANSEDAHKTQASYQVYVMDEDGAIDSIAVNRGDMLSSHLSLDSENAVKIHLNTFLPAAGKYTVQTRKMEEGEVNRTESDGSYPFVTKEGDQQACRQLLENENFVETADNMAFQVRANAGQIQGNDQAAQENAIGTGRDDISLCLSRLLLEG